MERILVLTSRNAALLLLFLFLLVSCARDDWNVSITCDEILGSLIPVTTELIINGEQVSQKGYLNPSRLSLGEIVRIEPDSTNAYAETAVRVPTLSSDDLSPIPVKLRWISINDGFQVKSEQDVKAAADTENVDLLSAVLNNTDLRVGGAIVRTLRDVPKFISKNSEVVRRIRTATGSRFAVVSGTIAGQFLALEPTYKSYAAVDTFYLGDTYVHLTYSCPVLDSLAEVMKTGASAPVIYLTAVRYDEPTAQITVDPRPLAVFQRN